MFNETSCQFPFLFHHSDADLYIGLIYYYGMGFIRKNGFGQIEIADIMGNWEHLQLPQPDLFGLEMNLNLQCNQPLEGFFTGSSFLPMFDPKIELPELKLPDILNPRKVWW